MRRWSRSPFAQKLPSARLMCTSCRRENTQHWAVQAALEQCAGRSQSWNATCHTVPSRSSKRVHCRTASRQLPDVRNHAASSSATCGNTLLRWGAAPVTKMPYAKQSYRPRCRKQVARFCEIRGKQYLQPVL